VMSLLRHLSCVCIDYVIKKNKSRISSSFLFYSTGFLTNVSEKRKSTSPSAIYVKNRQKTIVWKRNLTYQADWKKVNELLTYGVMLHSLTVA